jgi:hypothetical protein
VKILMISCQRSLHELEQALIIRSCEDPADILDASLHCLAQVLTRRSCGHLGAVLSKRSWHDLAQDLSKNLVAILARFSLKGPIGGVLEVLVRKLF